METSDKWRLAKRELICFLPDSLDNDIGINYEDEDGVESFFFSASVKVKVKVLGN